ncbi:MAG TPA: alkaline phosphatase family protein [Candidatus Sulfotelmatobacter sp.]|jgi:phospholipase C|nr:alkaline phosphatase family protein [Candidatus Sulfotelmatobacter sp.]
MTLNFDRLKTSDAPRRTLALLLALTTALGPTVAPAFAASKPVVKRNAPVTATPIQHLVVIFQENISFDHYFGTYPVATNPAGEPKFTAAPNTPTVNGLTNALLTFNPNLNPANGAAAANPFRLDRSQAVTTDQDHSYTAEQQAFDAGLMDLFPVDTGFSANTVMGYFDGNTATAMWNYAQFFAMSDNSYGTTFGPSSPGVVNLVSGQTNGVIATLNGTGDEVNGGPDGSLTLIGDADPIGDVCSSSTRAQATMGSQNIGNLLSAANITWGSFMGGFNLSIVNPNGTTGCNRSSTGLAGTTSDYIPHHSFFNYYTSTSNPAHTRPASDAEIGNPGPANHQYDIDDFFTAAAENNLPAVSFLKAAAYQDGHAGYSDPLDEQTFLVNTINFLQTLPSWSSTAVIIMYDDSDGWYDHQMGPILNTSTGPDDALTGPNACGTAATSLPGYNPTANPHALGRCGYGPRLPLMVISPWARQNFVDNTLTDQTSIIHFIEDNWLAGQRIGQGSFDALSGSITQMFNFTKIRTNDVLFLNPGTGERVP